MSSRLPIELIEHSICFLYGDIATLATCSLVCHDLLPVCRSLLWRDLKISMTSDGKPKDSFLFSRMQQILALNPDIGLYVRSSSFDFYHSLTTPTDIAVCFCKSFLSLRSLTFCNINAIDIPYLLTAIDCIPSLEEFHVQDIIEDGHGSWGAVAHNQLDDVLLPRLAKVSMIDGQMPRTVYQQVLSFLQSSRHSSSLTSVDLRIGLAGDSDGNTDKWPGVPPFAPQLDHFGIILNDITQGGAINVEGRSHMDQVFAELPRANALRSLCIQYDCLAYFFLREYISATNADYAFSGAAAIFPYYLDKLSDLLSSPQAPPFPRLERLSLVFSQPLTWLLGLKATFERLAQAILGEYNSGERRYPRFVRLEVRIVIVAMTRVLDGDKGVERALERFEADKGKFVQMVADWARAGVDVHVSVV
ncbi:hypothetical protein GY45DRAFT_1318259 [Cubamyces sp. BRFM 1775]|nr:hypothetical protein GY45DRAFT_1318259 [Cubamyces sp. BRFM 1775]